MDLILGFFQQILSFTGPFILLLGLLVFVHELGHFLVAKWCGVKVEVFSLGFGKKLLQFQYGDTNYCISLIPLGGYVKMYGEGLQAEVSEDLKHQSFIHKPVGQRIAIVLAGPLMNLFFAFFLFLMIGTIGDRQPAPVVGDLDETSQAYKMGLRSGDRIVSIDDQVIQGWQDVTDIVSDSPGKSLNFMVTRESASLSLPIQPKMGPNENIFSDRSAVGQVEGLSYEANASIIGVPQVNSLAHQAGLRSLDVILKVNGKDVSSFRDLQTALKNSSSEESVSLQVQSYASAEAGPIRDLQIPGGKSTEELGLEYAGTYVMSVKEKSPAADAGLQVGDKILSINDTPTKNWMDIYHSIKNYSPETSSSGLNLTFLREGKERKVSLKPELTELMNQKGQEENRYTIGIKSSSIKVAPETILYKAEGLGGKISYGLEQTWLWTKFTVMSVVRLFQGAVSPKNIGGVITIGRVAGYSFEAGISYFLKTMAIISINLFLLNLLPVPVLDGGHLVFFGLEALKGSPVSLRKLEIAQQVGLTLLLLLMAFALFNDVNNLFSSSW